jgi:hypothetical protein
MTRAAFERKSGKVARQAEVVGFKVLGGSVQAVQVEPTPLFNRPYLATREAWRNQGQSNEILLSIKTQCVEWHTEGAYRGSMGEVESLRGEIRTFSRKSRSRLIKFLMGLEERPTAFGTFTYDPEILLGMSDDEIRDKSGQDLHAFEKRLKRFGVTWGVWRREWKYQKSGVLKGSLVPHFHLLAWVRRDDRVRMKIMRYWVSLTGASRSAAYNVAGRKKSWQWLDGKKGVLKYVSKYAAKGDEAGVALGRSWGYFGDVPICKGVEICLDARESIHLRRLIRRWLKSIGKENLIRGLSRRGTTFTYFLGSLELYKLLALAVELSEVPF